jgi:hypothetical protein
MNFTELPDAAIKKRLPDDCKSVVEQCLLVEEVLKEVKNQMAWQGVYAQELLQNVFDWGFDPAEEAEKVINGEYGDPEEYFPGGADTIRMLINLARYSSYNRICDAWYELEKARNAACVVHTKVAYYLQEERQ